jgi:exosortase/archaeosortase family protein
MKRWLKSNIAIFLYKVLGIYILWYLIYDLWILPAGWLDAWVCKDVARIAYHILQSAGYTAFVNGRHVGVIGTTGVMLVNGCSSISAMGLFVGFVAAYPGQWVPRILFILVGIGIIYLVNIIRIVGLSITLAHWSNVFNFMHNYSSTALFYIVIFGLWMIWANYGGNKIRTLRRQKSGASA